MGARDVLYSWIASVSLDNVLHVFPTPARCVLPRVFSCLFRGPRPGLLGDLDLGRHGSAEPSSYTVSFLARAAMKHLFHMMRKMWAMAAPEASRLHRLGARCQDATVSRLASLITFFAVVPLASR